MRNTLLVTASVRSISENGIDAVPADENQFVKGEITKTNNPLPFERGISAKIR
jgi:hypothetical protein